MKLAMPWTLAGISAVLLAASLSASPVQAFTPERAGIMVDAVRANGCQMAGNEAAAALEPLGLDSLEVQTFVDVLFAAQLVTLSPDFSTLMLSDELCIADPAVAMPLIVAAFEQQEIGLEPWRPDFDPARGADLISIIRENGCALTDQQAGEILPGQDFSPDMTRDIVTLMIDADLAFVSPDGASVNLSADLCSAAVEGDTQVLATAISNWNAAQADEPNVETEGARE